MAAPTQASNMTATSGDMPPKIKSEAIAACAFASLIALSVLISSLSMALNSLAMERTVFDSNTI